MSTVETRPPFFLGPEMAGTLMTPEEFDAITEVDEDFVYELVHGVLVVSPPPLEMERGPNEVLGQLLLNYREQHPQGAALDWTLPENNVRTPDSRRRADRVIWAGLGRVPRPRRDPPTIVVEFVSAGKRNWQRDYVEKKEEYLATGIAEYWLFDRFRRVLTVFRKPPARPAETVVREKETYHTPLLPGFELPVARILAVADMFAPAEAPKKKRPNGPGKGKKK